MSRAWSLPSVTSTRSSTRSPTRSSCDAALPAAMLPALLPATERGSVSEIGARLPHVVANLDLRAVFEAPVLQLEPASPVEDQRRAVGPVGRALDGVEALLAEVLE